MKSDASAFQSSNLFFPSPAVKSHQSGARQRRSVRQRLSSAVHLTNSIHTIDRLREMFSVFIGITLAFTVINFVFLNVTGGCLVLFSLLSAVWCFLDRKRSTYVLNTVLQFLLGLTVAVAVGIYFPGFEAYATDAVLRSISVAHVPLAFIFSVLSLYLACVDPFADDDSNTQTQPHSFLDTTGVNTGNLHSGNMHTGNVHTADHTDNMNAVHGGIHTGSSYVHTRNIHTANLHTGNVHTGHVHTANVHTGNVHTGNMPTGDVHTGALGTNVNHGVRSVALSCKESNVPVHNVPVN